MGYQYSICLKDSQEYSTDCHLNLPIDWLFIKLGAPDKNSSVT